MLVDPHQIQQVFLNLLNNARQAIEGHRPKGTLRIRMEALGLPGASDIHVDNMPPPDQWAILGRSCNQVTAKVG